MIDVILGGNTKPKDRVSASVSAAIFAIKEGASVIRTHDVKQTKDAIKVWQTFN